MKSSVMNYERTIFIRLPIVFQLVSDSHSAYSVLQLLPALTYRMEAVMHAYSLMQFEEDISCTSVAQSEAEVGITLAKKIVQAVFFVNGMLTNDWHRNKCSLSVAGSEQVSKTFLLQLRANRNIFSSVFNSRSTLQDMSPLQIVVRFTVPLFLSFTCDFLLWTTRQWAFQCKHTAIGELSIMKRSYHYQGTQYGRKSPDTHQAQVYFLMNAVFKYLIVTLIYFPSSAVILFILNLAQWLTAVRS